MIREYVCGAALCCVSVCGQTQWIERLDEALFIESETGYFRSDLSGLLDAELYYTDGRPPGLVFPDDRFFFNPRLTLYLDTRLGDHWYSLVQVRADRGFDPGSDPDGALRADEYLIRYSPLGDSRLNVQAGKFPTLFGGWVRRHDSWNNPFINAPLPYENVTIVSDVTAPPGPAGFLGRRGRSDNKPNWLPVIWGPSYTVGASVFGLVEKFEYGFEFKNASLSSRTSAWDDYDWSDPTLTGRIGWRPNAMWNFGLSGSGGGYLLDQATGLPGGVRPDDYRQWTLGHDAGFAWRHLELWGEVIASRFEVPLAGDADTISYFIEGRYKLSTRWFGALRWNQQFFEAIDDGAGGRDAWDRDAWRAEGAVGYRLDRHLQAKLQYSYNHQRGPFQQGEQWVAAQVTVRF